MKARRVIVVFSILVWTSLVAGVAFP